jgi:hypothetical protein
MRRNGLSVTAATTPIRIMLIEAARYWRQARDGGQPVQPFLSRKLVTLRSAMLVPTLDSLLRFYELALGRQIKVNGTSQLSDDETLLLMLMTGARAQGQVLAGGERARRQLDNAIRSARIMLGLVSAEGVQLPA